MAPKKVYEKKLDSIHITVVTHCHVNMMKNDPKVRDFFNAILSLKDAKECQAFFSDLCTPKELKNMVERWQVARLLHQGNLSYLKIHQLTGASTTTIGRVARFLYNEPYEGYQRLLKRIAKHL